MKPKICFDFEGTISGNEYHFYPVAVIAALFAFFVRLGYDVAIMTGADLERVRDQVSRFIPRGGGVSVHSKLELDGVLNRGDIIVDDDPSVRRSLERKFGVSAVDSRFMGRAVFRGLEKLKPEDDLYLERGFGLEGLAFLVNDWLISGMVPVRTPEGAAGYMIKLAGGGEGPFQLEVPRFVPWTSFHGYEESKERAQDLAESFAGVAVALVTEMTGSKIEALPFDLAMSPRVFVGRLDPNGELKAHATGTMADEDEVEEVRNLCRRNLSRVLERPISDGAIGLISHPWPEIIDFVGVPISIESEAKS